MAGKRNSIRFDGSELEIEHVPIGLIKEDPSNPRDYTEEHINELVRSARRLGVSGALITDENFVLIAGTGMYRAYQQIGLATVPVIVLSNRTAAEKAALRIAYNRLAEKGRWNLERLGASFNFIIEHEVDFDLEVTGYEVPEIDVIMLGGKDAISDAAKEAAEVPEEVELEDLPVQPVSQLGDVFRIEQHVLAVGDGTYPDIIRKALGGKLADLVLSDLPYNIPGAHIGGRGSIGPRDFVQASGEMSSQEYQDFIERAGRQMSDFSKPGAYQFLFAGWYCIPDMLAGFGRVFAKLAHIAVWAKTNGGMGFPWRNAWEAILVYRKTGGKARSNVQLGKFGRNRTDVFRYAGVNVFRKGRMEELRAHPTCKPVTLLKDLILDVTPIGGLVLDPFVGSGSTIIAAHQAKRRAIGIDLDPRYVDVAIKRIETELGISAIHESGMTFAELAAHRGRN